MKFKTYLIYNEFYAESKRIMLDSLKTYDASWNVEPFNGCSPDSLKDYQEKYKIVDGERSKNVKRSKVISKKCCFYSHYYLWQLCAAKLDYIVIVEHDTEALVDFPKEFIEQFLAKGPETPTGIQVSTHSMLKSLKQYNKFLNSYNEFSDGIHEIFFSSPSGRKFFAGGTGHILNKAACKYLIADCKMHGWAKNDLLFATDNFPLYFAKPSLVKYCPDKEINTSSRRL